jgi:hypothetical protein
VTDTAIQKTTSKVLAEDMERVLIMGDLAMLKPEERLNYYKAVCESVGLNPLTRPLEYITLNGKLTLYARRECTEQLRKIHKVSIVALDNQMVQDVYVVKAKAEDKTGRTDCSTGAVALGTLKGEALANGLMKAETKAKRRVTLSICGLGLLDESEIDTVHDDEPPAPEPNMDVKCSACGGVNGHETDCATKQPFKPKAAKPKAEAKPEPVPSKQEQKQEEAPKQAEGQVIEPEKSDNKFRANFYVEQIRDGMTKSKAKFQTLTGIVRGRTDKIQIQVFHASLRENTGLLKDNWVDIEVTAKPKTSNPSETMYALENIFGCEDENGYTPWKDGKPAPEDVTQHGVPAGEVFGDTP